MSARRHYEDGAGPWVAFMDHDVQRKDGAVWRVRSYPWKDDGKERIWSWTTNMHEAIRYDSKSEALRAVRRHRPRVRGVVTGAELAE